MAKKILLVEDEVAIRDIINLNLELEGYEVTAIADGKVAMDQLHALDSFDLVILDVMLPHVSGFDLCRAFRRVSNVPILFLSAKGTTTDRIAGLKLGANDYLPKPFDLEELLLRVSILAGKKEENRSIEAIQIGDKRVDFKSFQVYCGSEMVATLSKREIDLLKLFEQHKGEVISRSKILDEVWGVEQFPTSRTIDNYILNFRKLFEMDARNPSFFHSIRGVGYKFTP